jgi:hypothetical protein
LRKHLDGQDSCDNDAATNSRLSYQMCKLFAYHINEPDSLSIIVASKLAGESSPCCDMGTISHPILLLICRMLYVPLQKCQCQRTDT